MDEEVVDQAAPLEVAEGPKYLTKEDEYSQRHESCKIPRPEDIPIPAEDDYSQIPPREYEYIPRGQNVVETINHETTTEHPRPCIFIDDTGVMVEELTVKSYDGSSLDIGTSNNRERMHLRQNHWRHLFYPGSDSGAGNSLSDTGYRYSGQVASSAWEDIGSISYPEFLGKTSLSDNQSNVKEWLTTDENKVGSSDVHGGIQTKIICKSGFSEFFVQHTLKGKDIVCKGPSSGGLHDESGDQNQVKLEVSKGVYPDVPLIFGSKAANSSSLSTAVPRSSGSDYDGMTLREWLKSKHNNKASKSERLYIFRKIVDLVDSLHSQGVALCNLRPSFIKLLPLNQVMYLGLTTQKQMLDNSLSRKRPSEQVILPSLDMWSKKKSCESVGHSGGWNQYTPISDLYLQTANDSNVNASGPQDYCSEFDGDFQVLECSIQKMSSIPFLANADKEKFTSASDGLEDKWYTSPEGGCSISTNIYSLGVLLFELLGHFDSERARIAAMSDLHYRILPPTFLSADPKEAGFCLWLLHPEASLRPTTREILQSELTNGLQEAYSEELSSNINQDDAESELLLHFLISLKDQKQKDTSKLVEEIRCLESDTEEMERRHRSSQKYLVSSGLQNDSCHQKESKSRNKDPSSSETLPLIPQVSNANEPRLMRNICQLESAYFCMRSKIQLPEASSTTHPDKGVLKNRENQHLAQNDDEEQKPTDPLGVFFDGLCKYARYSRFEVRGLLRNADFNNPMNVICSLSFDRDEDYFAAAGISKKIKIFEFNGLFNDSVDIYYPVAEMPNNSKLTCVCWNNYIKNYLASTDYDGTVKLWDASRGQGFSQFTEHQRRAWSVDFSPVYPTKFASGSDDCSVKLWSISERKCLGTIRNDANVCCVQFSAHSTHFLAFGSADYMTYCYDLRNLRHPWCVLDGHEKAVSYVKFLDSETLVSASTDNTLKIWDLNKTSPVDSSTSACSLTLSGHTNEKNFVGLSVAGGYIACGSETNEVYAYYRSLPMPITSHKFGSIDPISGKETDDDNGQFVSSVCWRGKSDMVIAANSSGCIKVLQMV